MRKLKYRTLPYPIHWNKPLQMKWYSYVSRSVEKGKEFTLSDDLFEYLLTQKCGYCGNPHEMTIDRKDSSIGYTPANVQPVCNLCNKMKLTQTEDEFKARLLQIVKHKGWI